MKPVSRYRGNFRWEAVPTLDYEPGAADFRAATRQVLFGADLGLASELRYFELAAGAQTRLERHRHAHAVLILRGQGRVLVDTEIHDVAPFDLVRVASHAWHQFRASPSAPLGFLCLVDARRDPPQLPTPEELAALRRHPALAAFLRG